MGAPDEVFSRFLAKQQAKDQFSENIQHVIHGGGGGGALRTASRNRSASPGLKAGAALALGATPAAAANEAYAEAQAMRQQVVSRARQSTLAGNCPFDDHSAFGKLGSNSSNPGPAAISSPTAGQSLDAYRDARTIAARNRAAGTSIGGASPFDAPEKPTYTSAYAAAASAENSTRTQAFADARLAALKNKSRVGGGADSLISGGYLMKDTRPAGVRNGAQGLPPKPGEQLLPQAQLKLNYDGGTVRGITEEKAVYLNSMVTAENNRNRQEVATFRLG